MDNNNQIPLGCSSDLKYSFSRQVKSLIKTRFLIKFRNKTSIIEIFISLFIIIIAAPAYYFTKTIINSDPNPQIEKVTNVSIIDWFSAYQNNILVVLIPDKPLMHYLIGNTTILKIAIEGGRIENTNISFLGTKYKYLDTDKELETELFLTNNNAIGIEWENIDSKDALTNPQIKVRIQNIKGNSNINFFLELRDSIIRMIYMIKKQKGDSNSDIKTSLSLNTTLYKTNFAHPEIIKQSDSYAFVYGIIASLVIVIATMPDMELLFDEKENRILAYSIQMGMSETAFWLSNFIVEFIVCLVCYIDISVILIFWFGMVGNGFSILFVFSIFYIFAEICFQFFISTFIHNTANGRWMVISLIMAGICTGFIFQYTAMDKNNSSYSFIIVNIFSAFPISAYQLFIIQGSISTTENLPLFRWNNMKNENYYYPPWYAFMWIIIDIVFYLLLFFISNMFLPRQYGLSPFKIMKYLKRNKNDKDLLEDQPTDSDEINHKTVIKVENLSKEYKQMNDTMALDDISFEVINGEVILIIGPNGAGKSTLINCLSRIIQPTSGKISINNVDSGQKNIGICYQENILVRLLTVEEHFELFGAYRGVSQKVLKESINYLDAILNLNAVKYIRAGNLSGGQKRKLCIALSLLGNPEIILMDEPTACVDVPGRFLIWKMISKFTDKTLIIVSHEVEEAEFVSSKLLVMIDGKISFNGTSTELKQKHKCGYILRINIEEGKNIDSILNLAKKFVPEAEISEDREDVIIIPDSENIPKFLHSFTDQKSDLGVNSFTFSIEHFEDVLMDLVYK